MQDRVPTYTRLLKLLADGEWHGQDELRKITSFPEQWMNELRHDGHEIAVHEDGAPVVRLKSLELPTAI